jgi:hypothetical protein
VVTNAAVSILFSVPAIDGTPAPGKISGLTDSNGVFTCSHDDRSVSLAFHIQKEGYYATWVTHYFGFSVEDKLVDWNPSQILVLKKIIQPIPMYAKALNTHVPLLEKPVGFDLMVGEWVAPYGKGVHADVFFTAHLDERSATDFDSKLIVSFPNKGDGIQSFIVPETEIGSELRSLHQAPTDGYEIQWIKARSQKPGEPSTYGNDLKLNFYFRVRTILDDQGNVKSALYGKIYGDFMHFRYYLNPTYNDRNIEFDPKQNLIHGLRGSQIVDVP